MVVDKFILVPVDFTPESIHALHNSLQGFSKSQESYNITSIPVIAGATDEDLLDFALRKKTDLLVLATHQRTFMESLGHRSITKKVLSHPVLPVMILHGSHKK